MINGEIDMKMVLKIGIAVLAIAGVLYWLFAKVLKPARYLRDRYKRPIDEDEVV